MQNFTTSPPPPAPGQDCGLGAITDLNCGATGLSKQAAVTNEVLPTLQGFQNQFGTAKTDYGKARDAAKVDVDAAVGLLDSVHALLRCRIDDEQRSCLEQAVVKVFEEITACTGTSDCCPPPSCDFDCDPDDDTVEELASRIAKYRNITARYTACFTALIAEQTALPARAAALKADAAQLATDAAAEATARDVVRLYARLLVADRQRKAVWHGFGTVASYVDRLCKELVCILKGWQAIAVLEGAKAGLECQDAAKAAACDAKRQHVVDEVLTEYEKLCPPSCPPSGNPAVSSY
ncbi:hypothetical protein [Saccharothrix sp. ST-888]|uniref:hypothetical protein n=1 Tax=Saccharothrix sp. ST-888 TaxID=1427391 RepID=UPI0005EC30DB|nr:hypothetical protein [Saccharothrix sp. ST-888]KJK59267.1 hypothetical protein UK12_05430 [Saccharothrix sp. ST-888]